MHVRCIREGALRLCLALILGLLLVSGYVVAPILFRELADPGLAGQLAGTIFHLVNRGALILAMAVIVFWWRMGMREKWRWITLLLLMLFLLVNEFALAPQLAEIKVQLATPGASAARLEILKQSFAMKHGISASLHFASSLLAITLVARGGLAGGSCTN